jgi:hypothetical protein
MFDEHWPEGGRRIRKEMDALKASFADATGDTKALEWFVTGGQQSTDELLLRAARDPANARMYVSEAVSHALEEKDAAGALQIAEQASLDEATVPVRSMARDGAARLALDRGDVEGAFNHAQSIPDEPLRVTRLAYSARALLAKGDAANARRFLGAAERDAVRLAGTERAVEAMFAMASAAVAAEPKAGAHWVSRAVEYLARPALEAAPTGCAGPSCPSPGARAPRSRTTYAAYRVKELFADMAKSDPGAALAAASRITPEELAVAAQVGACRGVLRPTAP